MKEGPTTEAAHRICGVGPAAWPPLRRAVARRRDGTRGKLWAPRRPANPLIFQAATIEPALAGPGMRSAYPPLKPEAKESRYVGI